VLQIVVHELGSIFALWRMKVPIRLRFFGFGANATASLEQHPRDVWRDAVIGLAGPLTGTIVSMGFAGVYEIMIRQTDSMHLWDPFFLGMACVGYFYNLFTLIPILDLEGGWIAPALAPQAWLAGLIASLMLLTSYFNLVLVGVVCFGLPRLILLLRARAPRTDTACTGRQRITIALVYFLMVLGLAYFSSTTFATLPTLVRNAMGD
jgi:Zn-dependent protease